MGVNYYQIVDGQQRLATILVWLSVLRDLARENKNDELATHINDTFLFAINWESGKQVKVPKLQLGELDKNVFQCILEGKGINSSHLLVDCYEFFKNKEGWEEAWQVLLNRVSIVHINAFNHFNAFRLFETLNDRGLELSAADLIKNMLLMKVSSNEEMFKENINEWNDMYQKIRDKEPVKFIRRYMLANYRGKISDKKLYEGVRKRLENVEPNDIYTFTKKLNRAASVYKKIYEASFSSPKINKKN